MGNVANDTAATKIQAFLTRLYKPIYVWAKASFATKDEVAAITGAETVTEQEAHSIWTNYVFATTDSDSNNINSENDVAGNE